ncbi:uncharacterized protein TNCV_1251241 [Trichonephila clavipes]|nr:uncharacterized protein TNCV_1251241 [Trichonephila clavipes]
MDPIDAFPEPIYTTAVPVTLPDKPDALEYAARQGQVRACIIYQEHNAKRVFVLFCKDHWHKKNTWLDNFKRVVMKAKHANEFRLNDVMWEKTSKGMKRNPDRLLKNTDNRMIYIYGNIFFAKKDFTFGLRTVKSGEIHFIQRTHVPMLIYEFPASSLKCRDQPNVIRRSFEPHDQMLYHRTIVDPHTAYPIPVGTNYIVLTVQKTAFGLDIIPESLLPQLIHKEFHVGDFRKMKTFDQTPYKLPLPTPIHIPAEKRPLEETSLPFSKKRSKVRITPVMRRVSRQPELPMAPVQIPHVPEPMHFLVSQVPQPPVQIPHVPEPPVQIPHVAEPPVQIPHVAEPVQIPVSQVPQSPVQIPDVTEPVQIPVSQFPQPPVQIPHVPEPPVQNPHVPEPVQIPVSQVPQPPGGRGSRVIPHVPEPPVQIPPELDPFEPTNALDQFMSFVFEPPDQELQLLHTVPSNFDGDLISFLDEFERELAPMDLIMPILDPCVKKSIGFKAIQPMDLSVNSCL